MAKHLAKINSDVLDSVISVAGALPDFVQAINFVNGASDYSIILFDAVAIQMAEQVTQLSGEQTLSYDTTFKLANIYVSPLLCRLTILEGAPVYPLAFFLHYRKLEATHSYFWNFLKHHPNCAWLRDLRIVEDQETALNKATTEAFPEMRLAHCWNHLDTNLKRYLIGKVSPDEAKFYREQVRELLGYIDESSFQTLLENMSRRWSADFVRHFQRNLLNPIRERAAVFALERMDYPRPNAGITINASESMNNVLKAATSRKEVEVDVLILVLYQLQTFYSSELKRATSGEGQWRLQPEFDTENCLALFSTMKTHNLQMDLEEIKSCIRGALLLNPVRPSNPQPRPSSQILAERAIAENQVSWILLQVQTPSCVNVMSFLGY